MEAVEALTRLGGVARYGVLMTMTSKRALADACARGAVVRIARSRYALPAADQARVAAARAGGVVSHLSAALAHGWPVKRPPELPMVTVRRNRTPKDLAGIGIHFADWTADEVAGGVTTPIRTVLDCARTLPFDEALAVADSALRAGAVRRSQLDEAAPRSPRTGRRAALRVAAAADARAANPFESVLRAVALDVPGLAVQPQGRVGSVGHADLTDSTLRIAVEADSFEWHTLPEAFRYDVRRYTAMTRLGWLVARFAWEDAMHNPGYVHEVLADLVALRAGQHPVRRSRRRSSTS